MNTKPQKLRILLVEDDQVDQIAFKRFITQKACPYDATVSGSTTEAKHLLAHTSFDAVLVDYLLGDGTAFDLFEAVKDTPIIVITGSSDTETAVKAMKAGARDYLVKDPEGNYLKTLPLIVENAIRRSQAEKELQRYREHLEKLVEARTAELQQTNKKLLAEIEEHKRAEVQLAASEANYRNIFELSPVGIVTVNLKGFITSCNPAFCELSGFPEEALVGKHFTQAPTLRAKDIPQYIKVFNNILLGSRTGMIEFPWVRSDGKSRLGEAHIGILKDEGKNIGVQVILRDITEQKRAFQLLQALNEVGQTMQEALTPQEVFATVGQSFKKLGISCAIFRLDETRTYMLVESLNYQEKITQAAENLSGLNRKAFRISIDSVDAFRKVIRQKETLLIDHPEEPTRQLLPLPLKEFAGQILKVLRIPNSIDAPLIVENVVIGMLAVQSAELTKEDIPAITAFAHQMATAWRKAQLLEQTQQELAERKRTEAALRASEARLQSIFRTAPIGIGLLSANRVHLQTNAQVGQIIGRTSEEIIGKSVSIFYPTKEDFDYVGQEKDSQIREHGMATIETRWLHKDGHIVDVLLNLAPLDPDDPTAGTTATVIDITDRKRAQAEREQLLTRIQHQAQQMQQIMDTVPEGVLLLDARGKIVVLNPTAEVYLATLAGESMGETLTHLGNRPIKELLTSPPKGLWHEAEVGGRNFQVLARSIETSADLEGWLLVIRDVTQEREIQKRAQQQERLAAVGQLAAGIAHDFNNIMAVIVLYTQMAQMAPNLPLELRDRLHTVSQQARRATELIQQILDFSRRAVLERRPIDLAPFLKEQVRLLQRTLPESIQITLAYSQEDDDAGDYTINADPTRIQQVIMNLAVNARDAMPEGGALHITLSSVAPEAKIHCTGCGDISGGQWVRIAVADTGSGIPENVLPHLFEPFFTTKPPGQGTGLGLAQVYGIVKQHEGHVDVMTQTGTGTTFILYLPALAIEKPAAIETGPLKLAMGAGELILVVEDQATTRQAIVDSLDLLGYRVIEAEHGRQALSMLKAHADEVALVLSDVVMPEMGGIALFHVLRQQGQQLPIVLMTGHPMGREMEEMQAEGLAGWILKPPNLDHLAQVIARAIKGTR
ncbi:MAG: PAS domain S-box protein [Anaerolineae bacterium]|jgi:PAS domain S-box-containing protein|nr:PAS domain S-box protein [Anaerolineae bacterium]